MTMTIGPVSTMEFIGLSETNTIGYEGHGREALQAHLIPRAYAGTQGDAHEHSGAPRRMPHGCDHSQTQANKLEEHQEEEREHDGTCLLWSPTAGNIAGGREQNICHLSSLCVHMLESTAQRGNRRTALSQEGRYQRKYLIIPTRVVPQ